MSLRTAARSAMASSLAACSCISSASSNSHLGVGQPLPQALHPRQLALQVGEPPGDLLRARLVLPEPRVGGLLAQVGRLDAHRLRVDHCLDRVELGRQFRYLICGIGSCHAGKPTRITGLSAYPGRAEGLPRPDILTICGTRKARGPARAGRARPELRAAGARGWPAALALTAALAVAGCASRAAPGTSASSAQRRRQPRPHRGPGPPGLRRLRRRQQPGRARRHAASSRCRVVTGAQQSLRLRHRSTSSASVGSSTSGARAPTAAPSASTRPSTSTPTARPTFYLPEPAGYPRFFVADVTPGARALTGVPRTRPLGRRGPGAASTARC